MSAWGTIGVLMGSANARNRRKPVPAVGYRRLRQHANLAQTQIGAEPAWVRPRFDQPACKPGSVWKVALPRRPFIWDARCRAPRATNPGGGPGNGLGATGSHPHARPPLFGLAPGGVCPAAPVTSRAVRSYRTLSPLPGGLLEESPSAVCFLWHFPWGRPWRPLAATVFPWSPDFPLPAPDRHKSGITGSGRPAGWHNE